MVLPVNAENPPHRAALDYHEATKLSYINLRTKPPLYKSYRGIPTVPLPAQFPAPSMSVLEALSGAATAIGGAAPVSLDALAQLLYYSAGLIRKAFLRSAGEVHYRAAASAGALYPIDLYAVCGGLDGLEAGVYHFSPADFSLGLLRRGDFRAYLARAAGDDSAVAAAPVSIVGAANLWRSAWKYRARGYRYCFWDCGTILANLLAVANSLGLPARPAVGFVDADVDGLLGLDPQDEVSLCVVPVGAGAAAPPEASGPLPAIAPEYNTASHRIEYAESTGAHRAGDLDDPAGVAVWRRAARVGDFPQATDGAPAAPIPASALPLGRAIVERGSTRRFARQPVPPDAFRAILAAAGRSAPWDFLAGGSLNDFYIIVNAVDSLEPGAYHYFPGSGELSLLKAGNFREEAAHLCFEQALGGDSAAVVFFMTDLGNVFDRMGARGYRAAQLEAGVMGGNMYLAAHALGLGATGMTFYDDEVTEFFSPHAEGKSVMFLVGLGLPGQPNRVRPYRSRVAAQLDALARGAS